MRLANGIVLAVGIGAFVAISKLAPGRLPRYIWNPIGFFLLFLAIPTRDNSIGKRFLRGCVGTSIGLAIVVVMHFWK